MHESRNQELNEKKKKSENTSDLNTTTAQNLNHTPH